MRYYPESEYDLKDAKQMNVEPWQLDLLKLNPSYVSWGPGEDYMKGKRDEGGWDAGQAFDSWKSFGPWGLDDLNEVVNFYFSVHRENKPCEHCKQSGLNPATHQISEDFYDFANTGRRWNDKITQDEVDALIEKNRLMDFTSEYTKEKGWQKHGRPVTAAEVNAAQNRRGAGLISHDAINRWILIETRAKRLGVYGHCEHCEGKGYIYTAPNAHVTLTLWFLHPRKGCSRGVEINNITQEDLPEIAKFLKQANERNMERFAKIGNLG